MTIATQPVRDWFVKRPVPGDSELERLAHHIVGGFPPTETLADFIVYAEVQAAACCLTADREPCAAELIRLDGHITNAVARVRRASGRFPDRLVRLGNLVAGELERMGWEFAERDWRFRGPVNAH